MEQSNIEVGVEEVVLSQPKLSGSGSNLVKRKAVDDLKDPEPNIKWIDQKKRKLDCIQSLLKNFCTISLI